MSDQKKDPVLEPENESLLEVTEMERMLLEKEKERLELEKELVEANKKINNLTNRSLQVFEENQQLTASPEIAKEMGQMKFQMKMAKTFIDSRAFPAMAPEQAYIIIKAGQELGLKPIEAMNALYVVNGSINPHSKFMTARIVENGYKIEYLNETDKSVDVRVFNDALGFDVTEKVNERDQILVSSKAMKFAKKNKMRFHGIRMIINFHLAHLFGSLSSMFTEDHIEQKQIQSGYKEDIIQEEMTPDNKNWKGCINALKKGIHTMDDLKERFIINQENEDLLWKSSGLDQAQ